MLLLAANAASTAYTAIIAATVSGFVTVFVNAYMNRSHNQRMAHGFVQKIIEFAMTYPYLEDDAFCAQYPNIPKDEERQRYEYYCCHVFNTLEHVYALCKDGFTEPNTILSPDEMIKRHRRWWTSDSDNTDGYPTDFREYVDSRIHRYEEQNK